MRVLRHLAGRARAGLVLALVSLGTGCASIPPDAGQHPDDPWERYNRHMTEFNDRLDRAVVKPVAQAYTKVVPSEARDCVGNVFSNIAEVPNALNNLLQGKPKRAALDVCRFVVNSTVGVLGCFDVARKLGIERSDEDFGQTLGHWGAGPGPYFVWPFFGPSTVRDSVGRVVGFYTDPLYYIEHDRTRVSLAALRVVDTRSVLLQAEKIVDGAALDRYQFIRDGYLQRRQNLVYDGDPPLAFDDLYNDPAEEEGANEPPAQAPEAQVDPADPEPEPADPIDPEAPEEAVPASSPKP